MPVIEFKTLVIINRLRVFVSPCMCTKRERRNLNRFRLLYDTCSRENVFDMSPLPLPLLTDVHIYNVYSFQALLFISYAALPCTKVWVFPDQTHEEKKSTVCLTHRLSLRNEPVK